MSSTNGPVVDRLSDFDLEQNNIEDAVLGAVIVDPELTSKLATVIQPTDFYRPIERRVYRKIVELVQSGKSNAEMISREILRELRTEPGYDAGWLAGLATKAHSEQAKLHYAPELSRLSRLRDIQRLGAKALQLNADPSQILSDYIQPADSPSDSLSPVSYSDLVGSYPQLRPPVIEGLLREGETANIIASPKVGKSFLAGNLAWCVATGRPFLGRDVVQGRVLILDNELHPETLASRLDHIAGAMQISEADREQVDVISLRGRLTPINALAMLLSIEAGRYRLVVLDALYRTLPQGTSENDNAAMMAVYNELDALAAKWQAAIVCVHHSSKGDQSGKGVTDVGAGAGAISRAADTHLVIRPHDDGEHCVLEAVCRSWKSPEPISIKFEWPVWYATTATPVVKKQTRQNTVQQQEADKQAMLEILESIPILPKAIQQNRLREKFGFGVGKFNRLVGGLVSQKKVKLRRKKFGKQDFVYYARVQNDSENDSESIPNRN